ncbi:MAG TPA: non-heme iron oxygenase ferredoxin subunit [Candidatus Macondimonas sp.]|nr:non-heme iron oxygenase ferredoxin subunit [Candidatus Macondimonas sp.]
MSAWQNVAPAADLAEGAYVSKEIDGIRIAVFRVDGALYAIEDVCTHDGGRLTGGPRSGCRVICPRHGAAFDLATGAVLAPPAYAPIATFPVQVVADWIQIRIPDDF